MGDPPSREDSLLGHMPSANPLADQEQQFDSAIAAVSGGKLGSCRADAGQQGTLERVSEGGNTAKDEGSRDGGEPGAPRDSPGQSLGDRPGQSLGSNGQQRNVSGGSSMSREDIREHAANIMDRMRSSAQPLPPTKVRVHGLPLRQYPRR